MATKISPRQLPVALETEVLNITELNFTAKIVLVGTGDEIFLVL